MSLIDITVPIQSGMITWPGDPPVVVERTLDLAKGDPASVSALQLGSHTGTHVDAFCHFKPGQAGMDGMALSAYIGPALVVAIDHPQRIHREALEALEAKGKIRWNGVERVLFKTRNSETSPPWYQQPFNPDFIHLTADAAHYLVSHGVKLVGIDYLSVDSYHAAGDVPVHHVLMDAGVHILEGLALCHVAPGWYELLCLPLSITGGDGAPARVVLRTL